MLINTTTRANNTGKGTKVNFRKDCETPGKGRKVNFRRDCG